jgi:hypothetical protein
MAPPTLARSPGAHREVGRARPTHRPISCAITVSWHRRPPDRGRSCWEEPPFSARSPSRAPVNRSHVPPPSYSADNQLSRPSAGQRSSGEGEGTGEQGSARAASGSALRPRSPQRGRCSPPMRTAVPDPPALATRPRQQPTPTHSSRKPRRNSSTSAAQRVVGSGACIPRSQHGFGFQFCTAHAHSGGRSFGGCRGRYAQSWACPCQVHTSTSLSSPSADVHAAARAPPQQHPIGIPSMPMNDRLMVSASSRWTGSSWPLADASH